ncbi:hypothetical protein N7489_010064 [Penicillium chrysogenum]|uniref:Uncharacterized protein n=1 Tax=Penicillium chrysogenum TaxID=5076 RepID=A0ABQ8WUP6_PENCH|nr:uncharacterized protein N7489_010064 [Penicillium chrysogenum]KAJ5229356.1 hypothetical protein N7489_010064 [Penicillium chrysogenum]KAJ5258760.1 hypothetical protein N7524_010316 [Penicillium chrysogenum]KAJ5282764.1 hypothetical protein N7505_000744 [Penicillium chrysogenum]
MFTNSMKPLALQAQWILGGPESPCYVGHSTKEGTKKNSDYEDYNSKEIQKLANQNLNIRNFQ